MQYLVLLMVFVMPSQAFSAEETIFKLIKQNQYKNSWAKIFSKTNQPDWVREFSRDAYGVAEPVENINVGGRTYKSVKVCETHNCLDSWVVVLFTEKGEKAWALTPSYANSSNKCSWYGQPTDLERKILVSSRPKCR